MAQQSATGWAAIKHLFSSMSNSNPGQGNSGGSGSGFGIKNLSGKSLNWIKKQKPTGWKEVPSDNSKGWKWLDEKGNERLRFIRPNKENPSNSQWSRDSNGYFRWQNEKGDFLDVNGKVVSPGDKNFQEKTHIIYEGPYP